MVHDVFFGGSGGPGDGLPIFFGEERRLSGSQSATNLTVFVLALFLSLSLSVSLSLSLFFLSEKHTQ